MKQKLKTIIIASAASALAFSALAQDTSDAKTEGQDYSHGQVPEAGHSNRLKDTTKASDVIGMTVKNDQGQKLGKVEDLALDVESGRIVQVIISTGGFMAMDKTFTAVPPGVLSYDAGQKVLRLDASPERFSAAPKFDNSKWDESTQSNQVVEAYGYYDQQPYFVANQDEAGTADTDRTLARTLPRNMDGRINTTGARTMDTAHNVKIASDIEATNNVMVTLNADGTWTHHYYPANSNWSTLGYVQKASKIMGTAVNNLQGEKLGDVDNLVVDLSAGRIVAVIVSTGGYLGMDGELSAVPPTAFRFNDEHDTLQLDTTKDRLARSPHFQSGQWPDFSQSSYSGGVYRAYNVEPYFNSDATNAPDTTAGNIRDRDRDNNPLTPLDQGNSQADIDTTAQIRNAIIAADGMSINGKNVKIITRNGRVTLRGPVNSSDEKRQIGDIADRIAQSDNVDNQLEVTLNTTSTLN
jgi:sporulation protein YlmC with PRC-barrel domain